MQAAFFGAVNSVRQLSFDGSGEPARRIINPHAPLFSSGGVDGCRRDA